MKNLQKLFSMAMLVCLAIATFSCSKDDEEISVEAGIIGEWEITSTETLLNGLSIDAFVKQLAEQSGASEEEIRNNDYLDYEDTSDEDAGSTMEFTSDKDFVLIGKEEGEKDDAKGTWEAGNNRTLILGFEGEMVSSEVTYDVTSLTSDALTLKLTDKRIVDFKGEEYEIKGEHFIRMKKK